MGFTLGPDGVPVFNNIPQTVVDFNRLRDLIIARGNRFKGTTAERNAWTDSGYAYEGQEWFDTTLSAALIRRGASWKREISFRHFTTARGGMTDGAPFFQVPVEDAGKDTEPAFMYGYSNTDGRVTLEPGVYQVHAKGHPGSVVTGTTFMQLRGTVQGVVDRKVPAVSADPVMYVSALFRADGTEGLIVEIQKQTGGSSNASGTLSIARIGGL
jgi:hypothetical protein